MATTRKSTRKSKSPQAPKRYSLYMALWSNEAQDIARTMEQGLMAVAEVAGQAACVYDANGQVWVRYGWNNKHFRCMAEVEQYLGIEEDATIWERREYGAF